MSTARPLLATLACTAFLVLSGCVYQPLYGSGTYAPDASGYALTRIRVSDVDTRVGQQVRNHLIFLLQGGREAPQPAYEVRIRTGDTSRLYAASRSVRDNTAGTVTVTVSYDLIDLANNTRIAGGSRVASAAYDRTGQSFANARALRDAENRAAREVAEQIRLALAADISQR